MNAANRVIFNTGVLYGRMAITIFISLYSTRLVLNALGAADFGIFNVVGGSIAMLTFLNAAMAGATQRFMSYSQGENDESQQIKIFNVSVVLHLMIALIIFIILEIAGYFLFDGILNIPENRIKTAKIIYQFMIFSTIFSIISVPYDAVINSHENMLYVAFVGILESILKLTIAFIVTYVLMDKLIIYGLLMAILSVVILIIMRVYCHKNYEEVKIDIKAHFDKKIFNQMSAFAGWNFLSSAASIISMQGMTILLNSFFGVIVNAAQGVAIQITGQLMAFSNTMLKALNPVIVKSEGSKNRNQLIKASMMGNKLSFFLFSFLSIPVIIEMPYILSIWLKNVPEFAVLFCRLALFRLSLGQLTVTFQTAIAATGNIRRSTQWESAIYILLIPITYIFFKFGAPPVTIYINLIIMVIALFFSRIYFSSVLCNMPIQIFLKDVVSRCLLIYFLVSFFSSIPLFFFHESWTRLLIVLISSFSIFIVLAFLIGLTKTEKQLVITIKNNLFIKINERLAKKSGN